MAGTCGTSVVGYCYNIKAVATFRHVSQRFQPCAGFVLLKCIVFVTTTSGLLAPEMINSHAILAMNLLRNKMQYGISMFA